MGEKAFRKIQFGKETVHGTNVAATSRQMGVLTQKSSPTIYMPEENTGTLVKYHHATKVAELAELTRDGSLTYEQCIYFFLMGIKGAVTPVNIEGDAYRWTFDPNLEALNNPDSFTIEYGDDIQAFESGYCMAKSLEISGTIDEPVNLKVDMFGRDLTKCAFTPALALPTVEDAMSSMTSIKIEDTYAALDAGTPKAKTLIDYSWKLDTGIHSKKFMDGELTFTGHGEAACAPELDLTFEFNSNANAEYDHFDSQVKRFIRLQTSGSEIETGVGKALILNLCGVYTEWDTLDERDGNDIVKVKLVAIYDPTWDRAWGVEVVNDVASLV